MPASASFAQKEGMGDVLPKAGHGDQYQRRRPDMPATCACLYQNVYAALANDGWLDAGFSWVANNEVK